MADQDDQEFFSSIPHVQQLLSQPANIQYIPTCRLKGVEATKARNQDRFFRYGLSQTDLVPFAIAIYEDPFTERTEPSSVIGRSQIQESSHLLIRKSTLILHLESGTNGFNGTAHGGLIATIIDEAMGSLILINHRVYSDLPSSTREKLSNNVLDLRGLAMFTAEMNVQFRAPLPTPGVVLVETVANEIRGRKVLIDVAVRGVDGKVYATCGGTWMSVRTQQKL